MLLGSWISLHRMDDWIVNKDALNIALNAVSHIVNSFCFCDQNLTFLNNTMSNLGDHSVSGLGI